MRGLFHDDDVRHAREHGGLLRLRSGRKLLLPRLFGFCGGVVHALRVLQDLTTQHHGRAIRLLGPIIHNDTVNDLFRQRGVHILPETDIERIFHTAHPRDTVVLPAFGVPVDIEKRLRQIWEPEQIVDTTCQYVQRVWAFVQELDGPDWTVLVHGKPGHPETRATVSRACEKARTVLLVPTVEDVDRVCAGIREGTWRQVPDSLRAGDVQPRMPRMAVVNQTTMLYSETREIDRRLRACAQTAQWEIRLANTVCRATQERQNAAAELCAQNPDVILVIGGYTSSNTAQLHRLAARTAPAFFVDRAHAVTADAIEHLQPGSGIKITRQWLPSDWKTLGILAGASCPASDVGDLVRRIRMLDEQARNVNS